jgi:hypothetical protein
VISNRFFSGGPGEKIHSLHPFCRSKNAPKLPFCRLPDWAYEALSPQPCSHVSCESSRLLCPIQKKPSKISYFFLENLSTQKELPGIYLVSGRDTCGVIFFKVFRRETAPPLSACRVFNELSQKTFHIPASRHMLVLAV